ncbi:MAG: TetR/AcrR family transcriptional regulator [Candidatus Dormibacteria bacterium]
MKQKRRTRAALLNVAVRLVSDGRRPTVAQVADEAGISRATAYRYFPSQESLLIEAQLELMHPTLSEAMEAVPADGPLPSATAIVIGNLTRVLMHESAFRDLLRLSLSQGRFESTEIRRLASRRVRLLEEALAGVRAKFGDVAYTRLLGGLALCAGPEAMVVLRDLCGFSAEQSLDVAGWVAAAIVAEAYRLNDEPGD